MPGIAAGHQIDENRPFARPQTGRRLAEQAAGELAAGGVVVDHRPSPWFQIHASACKTITTLSLRLRLGPQSRQPRAHKTTPGPTSYYETMDLLEGSDEDDGVDSARH